MARSTYFDLSRSADACLGSESGYAQRFQCGNVVKPLIWTGMVLQDPCIATPVAVVGTRTDRDRSSGIHTTDVPYRSFRHD